jgi:FMN phosphatase YigB (HAD superfamily)
MRVPRGVRCNFEPSDSVFVDDLIENIETARRLGMYGIHFHSPDQTKVELQRLGLL